MTYSVSRSRLAVGGVRAVMDSCISYTLHNSGTVFARARDQHSFSVERQKEVFQTLWAMWSVLKLSGHR